MRAGSGSTRPARAGLHRRTRAISSAATRAKPGRRSCSRSLWGIPTTRHSPPPSSKTKGLEKMSKRLDYNQVAPVGAKALGGVYGYVVQCGLPLELVDLIYLRISQINNCAYCLDMHSRSEEPTSELQSLMRISYAVFCLKKKKNQ